MALTHDKGVETEKEISRLDAELIRMFQLVELALVDIFDDISARVEKIPSKSRHSPLVFRNRTLLLYGSLLGDSTVGQRVGAAKHVNLLVDNLMIAQQHRLRSMEEAVGTLQELLSTLGPAE